jgi:hypothetical protein
MTELSANVSLEANQSGWTGIYTTTSTVKRIQPAGGSYDGSWALQVAPKSGSSGAAGVNNAAPAWVPGSPGRATVAGGRYTADVMVRAGVPGETLTVLVRETTPAAAGVGYASMSASEPDTAWHALSTTYTAKNAGDILHVSVYASNLASAGQYFQADCLSLQTPNG